MAAQYEHRGTLRLGHGPAQARLDEIEVVGHFPEVLDVPAVGLEALGDVVGVGELGRAVDGYVVVVIDIDEPPEAEVSGQGGGLVAHPFHQVTVATAHKDVVVDRLGAKARP